MGLGGMFNRFSNAARTVLPGIDPKKKLVTPATLTAPAPTATPTLQMPATVRESGATSATAALAASMKARKKGAGAGLGSIAQPTGTILTSTATPKTLLGY